MSLPRVIHPERAQGVDERIQELVRWWQKFGIFSLLIPTDGGVRTDEAHQAELFARGVSRAKTLAETAHGRGGALDAHPVILKNDRIIALDDTNMWAYGEYGAAAERFGLEWGGRWARFPDLGHVQVKNWRDLPFPIPSPETKP